MDVFSCVETHCDELDIVNIDNYACFLKNRKQKTVKRSGGIATFMNNNVSNHFSEIPTDCEYVQWFKVSHSFTQTEEDLILGTIYIPSENTKYFSADLLEAFYAEAEQFVSDYKYVILFGDFNARTATLSDIAELDETLFDFLDSRFNVRQ